MGPDFVLIYLITTLLFLFAGFLLPYQMGKMNGLTGKELGTHVLLCGLMVGVGAVGTCVLAEYLGQ